MGHWDKSVIFPGGDCLQTHTLIKKKEIVCYCIDAQALEQVGLGLFRLNFPDHRI